MSSKLSPEERQRLDTLFERAADLPPCEHAAFVERECGSSGALCDELGRLLAGLTGEDVLGSLQSGAPLRAGTKIGPYTLLERIGQGGMGEVYAAEQREPIHRRVALKIIRPGLGSGEVVARFHAERQALAQMAHPHVAQVFDAGATDDGRPYFAMELVAGDSITAYCDRRKLSTRKRLELFLAICDGVQHAHQKGIIHRDLKPSNLLVAEQDGGACAKIIDFGVARATTGRLAERTLHTMVGQIVGTLDYMSPEQADPSAAADMDTRSDIYSLGVVLYELVSGLLPFEHGWSGSSTPHDIVRLHEIVRTIRETDPPTPSTRLRRETATAMTISPLHGADTRSLIRRLTGDLDWICLKALEKDPARRYASASELAEDVRRHLAHQPVLAGRPGVLYRARKFVRRNRVAVAATVLVLLAVCIGVAGIVAGRFDALESERFERAAIDSERALGLEVSAGDLWPPYPDKIDEMEYWLSRASDVVSRLKLYDEMLKELQLAHRLDVDTGKARREDALVRVIERSEQLKSGLLAETPSAGHTWSMPMRLAWAKDLTAGVAYAGRYDVATRWKETLPAILDKYPELVGILTPQLDLFPLGVDEASNLWEFAHLMTGVPAQRVGGKLVLTDDTGVVLVLLHGGDFWMGTPKEKAFETQVSEGPRHEVRLSPFFLSKYEMTQGQWKRLTGRNPSMRPNSSLFPVEQLSWLDCTLWLRRAGLTLPSEAQWEYGARGGTQTAWSTGDDVELRKGAANVYGDGPGVPKRVGSYPANGFGLHDVHGNVWEWCLDKYGDGDFYDRSRGWLDPVSPKSEMEDPRRYQPGPMSEGRAFRGGGFGDPAQAARSAFRTFREPSFPGGALGVRPARRVIE